MSDIRLTAQEVSTLTGYAQPARQLEELKRQGFYRARLDRFGQVVLERAHYDAVCAGSANDMHPKVRPPKVKAAA